MLKKVGVLLYFLVSACFILGILYALFLEDVRAREAVHIVVDDDTMNISIQWKDDSCKVSFNWKYGPSVKAEAHTGDVFGYSGYWVSIGENCTATITEPVIPVVH